MAEVVLNQDQKQSLLPYAFGTAGIVLMFVPHTIVPLTGVFCLLMGFVWAYVMRARMKEHQYGADQMTYLIRTIWGGFGLLCIGLLLFLSVLYANADFTALKEFQSDADRGVIATTDEVRLMQALFVQSNGFLIFMTACICLFPMPVFMVFRMLKGIRRILYHA